MIKHLVLWKIKESYSEDEKIKIKENAKKHLEILLTQIPDVSKLELIINNLPTSNFDFCLESEFESSTDLRDYASHPSHIAFASTFITPFISDRACIDTSSNKQSSAHFESLWTLLLFNWTD